MSSIQLRPYQTQTLSSLFNFLSGNPSGRPVVQLPTGAGKSFIIAEFCRQSLEWWPDTRIIVLSHQKELIEQDAGKLYAIWPAAPIGIYAASLHCKELDMPITFASIQSIAKKAVPDCNVVIIDECHLINNEDHGQYRNFLKHIPKARVIGLTATPYRLGQGYLNEGPDALFTDILNPVSILELQRDGFLAKLRSKSTFYTLDVSNVHKRRNEFVEKELQAAVNKYETNEQMVDEIIHSASFYNRHHILIFCTGVDHAVQIAKLMNGNGVSCGCVHGEMSIADRDEILDDFKNGRYTAMTNANILTTGFDYPDIDLIAMLRPTLSPSLYMQMVGRGLRLKSNGGDCLVLDFAGNVERHGPIAYIEPPKRKGEKRQAGVAPCKECPQCLEILPVQVMTCPCCGYQFPKHEREAHLLFDGDINGDGYSRWKVSFCTWGATTSRNSGKKMLTCTFFPEESQYKQFTDYYGVIEHEGAYRQMSIKKLKAYCSKSGIEYTEDYEILLDRLNKGEKPCYIFTKKDGKYDKIDTKLWEEDVRKLLEQKAEEDKILDEAKEKIHSRMC